MSSFPCRYGFFLYKYSKDILNCNFLVCKMFGLNEHVTKMMFVINKIKWFVSETNTCIYLTNTKTMLKLLCKLRKISACKAQNSRVVHGFRKTDLPLVSFKWAFPLQELSQLELPQLLLLLSQTDINIRHITLQTVKSCKEQVLHIILWSLVPSSIAICQSLWELSAPKNFVKQTNQPANLTTSWPTN